MIKHTARHPYLLTAALALALTTMTARAQGPQTAPARAVVINGKALTDAEVRQLQMIVRGPVQPGNFWYDRISGAWGFEGGPGVGFIPAGLPFGGQLRADASHGTTGVFINGRQLHVMDVMRLQQWLNVPVMPGRYWVDAQANFGNEGGPMLGNLIQVAQANNPRIGRQGNWLTECHGGGCGSGNSVTGMGVITDGDGHGAVFTGDGHVISTP